MITEESIINNIEKVFDDKGYIFFLGAFSVNVFAIRCETGTNEFDDIVGIAYHNEFGDLIVDTYKGTTEPGRHWLENPMREEGCAIMVEGQYRGAYKVGPHGSKRYEACRQSKAIPVYRDNNKDTKHDFDKDTIQTGLFYTNIHHGYNASEVNKNSAGCIVIQYKAKFEKEFMPVIKKSCDIYGPSFTFTLLNESDF